jgi:hypothetical protein
MFGTPLFVDEDAAVFHTVWTYGIKALDARKKARMVCDSSLRAGQAHVLDKKNANCVDQTSSRMFYAIQPRRISWYTVLTCPTLLPKPHLPNKDSTSTPIALSMNGGYVICSALLWNQAKSFLSYLQCKATRNRPDYGKSMPTPFSRT